MKKFLPFLFVGGLLRRSPMLALLCVLHAFGVIGPTAYSFAQWSAIGNIVANSIWDFTEWNGKLYMGGVNKVNNNNVRGICSYDGIAFDSLPPAFDGGPFSLTVYNNELYAGGNLVLGYWPYVPGSGNIDRWNGSSWNTVGGGGQEGVEDIFAMAVYNGELYVGGDFLSMGGVSATRRIARWDGTQWKTVGGGFPYNETIQTMAVYNGELYVGGSVGLPGGPNFYYNLVRWNGTKWDSVGGKFGPGWVSSLCVDTVNNFLYIGGGINYAGSVLVNVVAKWDGTNLSAPGMGITQSAYAMTMYQGKLVVGGSAFSDTVLATWDGTYWCPIIPGPNSNIDAMEVYNGELYIGGEFDTVATIPASRIAKWSGNLCPNSGVNEIAGQIKFRVFPNPAKAEININVEGEENKEYVAIIYNSVGARIVEQKFTKQTKISTADFSKGIYQVQVCDKDGKICYTKKFVLE